MHFSKKNMSADKSIGIAQLAGNKITLFLRKKKV